jgi:putative IMPACT (imprinted ancient) family translation regulator
VRAYGGAARACLRDAPKTEVSERVALSARVPFDCLGRAYQAADAMGARRAGEEFAAEDGGYGRSDEQGVMLLTFDVEADKVTALAEGLRDGSGGRIRVSECERGIRGATGS